MEDAVAIIAITLLCLAFCGEPDLQDAAISHLMKQECSITGEKL